jgi:MarR family transcriptional regulator, organic hydroperoxide resistance regulator
MEENRELEQRYIKLKEFQDLFEKIFSKTKTQHNFFPKTKYNLSDGHILILTYLSRVKTCTASDISKYLGITSGGGTVLTDTLLRHNLINRFRLEEDRRVVQLSLTTEGKEIVNQIIENRARAFVELLHDLEETEIDQMLSVFRKLNNKLK